MTDENIAKLTAKRIGNTINQIGEILDRRDVSTDDAQLILSTLLLLVTQKEQFDGDGHAAALSLSDHFKRTADSYRAQAIKQ